MDKSENDGKVRTVEWALKRHFEGKSELSPYQVCNIMKTVTSASRSKTSTTKKKKNRKVSAEDLAEFKKITKQANDILLKYK